MNTEFQIYYSNSIQYLNNRIFFCIISAHYCTDHSSDVYLQADLLHGFIEHFGMMLACIKKVRETFMTLWFL